MSCIDIAGLIACCYSLFVTQAAARPVISSVPPTTVSLAEQRKTNTRTLVSFSSTSLGLAARFDSIFHQLDCMEARSGMQGTAAAPCGNALPAISSSTTTSALHTTAAASCGASTSFLHKPMTLVGHLDASIAAVDSMLLPQSLSPHEAVSREGEVARAVSEATERPYYAGYEDFIAAWAAEEDEESAEDDEVEVAKEVLLPANPLRYMGYEDFIAAWAEDEEVGLTAAAALAASPSASARAGGVCSGPRSETHIDHALIQANAEAEADGVSRAGFMPQVGTDVNMQEENLEEENEEASPMAGPSNIPALLSPAMFGRCKMLWGGGLGGVAHRLRQAASSSAVVAAAGSAAVVLVMLVGRAVMCSTRR